MFSYEIRFFQTLKSAQNRHEGPTKFLQAFLVIRLERSNFKRGQHLCIYLIKIFRSCDERWRPLLSDCYEIKTWNFCLSDHFIPCDDIKLSIVMVWQKRNFVVNFITKHTYISQKSTFIWAYLALLYLLKFCQGDKIIWRSKNFMFLRGAT